MKVCLIQGDQGGSGFLRVQEPARVARLAGVEVEVIEDIEVDASRHPSGLIEVRKVYCDADVIVFQRPLAQQVHAAAVAAKRQGIAVVADLDDDFHNVHESNIAFPAVDPTRSPYHNRNWLLATVKICDVITVSTPALVKYATGRTRAVVVRNRMPQRILDIPAAPRTGRPGWTGTTTTHPVDLSRARGVLSLTDQPLAVVGDAAGVARGIGAPSSRVVLGSGWVDDIEQYWRAIMDNIDVGIAPLEVSKFNKAKSWLKPLEFMSLGKPFVASPLPEYRLLADLSGGGEIATSSTQWATKVRDLLEDGEKQRTAGLEWARQNVLELHAQNWIDAWEMAMAKCNASQ